MNRNSTETNKLILPFLVGGKVILSTVGKELIESKITKTELEFIQGLSVKLVDTLSSHASDIETNKNDIAKRVIAKAPFTKDYVPKIDAASNTITTGWEAGHTGNNTLVLTESNGKINSAILPPIPIKSTRVFEFAHGTTDQDMWSYIVNNWTKHGSPEPTGGEIVYILVKESALPNAKNILYKLLSYTGKKPWTDIANWVERKIDTEAVRKWGEFTGVITIDDISEEIEKTNSIKNIHTAVNKNTVDIGKKLDDAPSDGKTYGRRSATWVEVSTGSKKEAKEFSAPDKVTFTHTLKTDDITYSCRIVDTGEVLAPDVSIIDDSNITFDFSNMNLTQMVRIVLIA